MAADELLDEVLRRAVQGTLEYIRYKGEIVMHKGKPMVRVKYSDTLLMFLLSGPFERFRSCGETPMRKATAAKTDPFSPSV
jgi:hypothetical protein